MTIGAFSIGARPIPGSSVSRPAEINGAQRLYLKLIWQDCVCRSSEKNLLRKEGTCTKKRSAAVDFPHTYALSETMQI